MAGKSQKQIEERKRRRWKKNYFFIRKSTCDRCVYKRWSCVVKLRVAMRIYTRMYKHAHICAQRSRLVLCGFACARIPFTRFYVIHACPVWMFLLNLFKILNIPIEYMNVYLLLCWFDCAMHVYAAIYETVSKLSARSPLRTI